MSTEAIKWPAFKLLLTKLQHNDKGLWQPKFNLATCLIIKYHHLLYYTFTYCTWMSCSFTGNPSTMFLFCLSNYFTNAGVNHCKVLIILMERQFLRLFNCFFSVCYILMCVQLVYHHPFCSCVCVYCIIIIIIIIIHP